MASRQENIASLIEPSVNELGFELWGVELLMRGPSTLLRVYIDAESGVSVTHCEQVSRQVGALLDVEDLIPGEYVLEVSSPGMDRPLYQLAHFAKFAGSDVRVQLRYPFEGQRRFKGLLVGIEGEDVVLRVEDSEYLLPFESIDKANVVPRF
ncbi:MAG: ribosome maturation factor RimP [Pseudomonadales bacterium]|nr:ribosome maturation factor RimP [Pseudomonadales bacterium]